MQARLALLHRLGENSRVSQQAVDRFDDALAKFMGINRTDGVCLDIIDRRGRISAGQLANETGLTTGAITAVIDRLEGAGYVQRVRDEIDRRKIWVENTQATRTIVESVFGFYDTMGEAMTGRFSNAQLGAISEFLEIGTLVQRHMAAGLDEWTEATDGDAEARADRAKAYRRALEAGAKGLTSEINAIGKHSARKDE